MEKLLKLISDLKKTEVKKLVDKRIKEFEQLSKKQDKEKFKELCFCLLTANSSAEKCIQIQNRLGNNLLTLSKLELSKKLKTLGYRFPNKRAEYISEARKHSIKHLLSHNNEKEIRECLVKNIKGLGYKEASHLLRNLGYKNLAIIDFHIVDVLVKNKLIKKPKSLTKQKYLEIEDLLDKIAKKSNLNLAGLDLYLWYLETGKVLK